MGIRSSATFYDDQYKFWKSFNSPKLFLAFAEYMFEDIEPVGLSENEQVLFDSLRVRMDNQKKRSDAGRKGGLISHGGGAPVGNSNARKTWDIDINQQAKQQANNKQDKDKVKDKVYVTTTNVVVPSKEEVEDKNKEKKQKYMDFVFLTESEHTSLVNKLGSTKAQYWIDRLNSYIGQIGVASASKKYKSHYFTILNRDRREGGKTSSDFAKDQALARQREKIREQIDEYLHPTDSDNVGSTKQEAQAFDRRGEIRGS